MKHQAIDYSSTDIKNEKISIACRLAFKERIIELAANEGLVISEFGYQVMEAVLELSELLPEPGKVLAHLRSQNMLIKALKEELKEAKASLASYQAQVKSLQEQKEALQGQLAKLKEESTVLGAQVREAEQNHLLIADLEALFKKGWKSYVGHQLDQGLYLSEQGVLAGLLYAKITSLNSKIPQGFGLKGEYRALLDRLRKQ